MKLRQNRHLPHYQQHRRVSMELAYKLKIEGQKCIIILPNNANLLDIHAILHAFKHDSKLTIKKVLIIKHTTGIKRINDITDYIKTDSFMELEYTIRRKTLQNREESSHILQENEQRGAEIHIECLENITQIPRIQNRRETAEKIIEHFKKKWKA